MHPLETVMSPEKMLSSDSHTIAFGKIFRLKQGKRKEMVLNTERIYSYSDFEAITLLRITNFVVYVSSLVATPRALVVGI